jgi:hypothetical protein
MEKQSAIICTCNKRRSTCPTSLEQFMQSKNNEKYNNKSYLLHYKNNKQQLFAPAYRAMAIILLLIVYLNAE